MIPLWNARDIGRYERVRTCQDVLTNHGQLCDTSTPGSTYCLEGNVPRKNGWDDVRRDRPYGRSITR